MEPAFFFSLILRDELGFCRFFSTRRDSFFAVPRSAHREGVSIVGLHRCAGLRVLPRAMLR